MTSTMTETRIAPLQTDSSADDDDLTHLVCDCDLDTALCGAKVPGECWVAEGVAPERDCVVCLYLDEQACGRCGHVPGGRGPR